MRELFEVVRGAGVKLPLSELLIYSNLPAPLLSPPSRPLLLLLLLRLFLSPTELRSFIDKSFQESTSRILKSKETSAWVLSCPTGKGRPLPALLPHMPVLELCQNSISHSFIVMLPTFFSNEPTSTCICVPACTHTCSHVAS